MSPSEKPVLRDLFRNQPTTPEGKYLVKRRDGTVVEWPHFVLGARDPAAAIALRVYTWHALGIGSITKDLAMALLRYADRFDAYRAVHGDGDPGRGAHRKDDPTTIAEMRKGWSA